MSGTCYLVSTPRTTWVAPFRLVEWYLNETESLVRYCTYISPEEMQCPLTMFSRRLTTVASPETQSKFPAHVSLPRLYVVSPANAPSLGMRVKVISKSVCGPSSNCETTPLHVPKNASNTPSSDGSEISDELSPFPDVALGVEGPCSVAIDLGESWSAPIKRQPANAMTSNPMEAATPRRRTLLRAPAGGRGL